MLDLDVHRREPQDTDTFVVEVKFRQNATWQGTIKYGGGQQVNFRSALEMIKVIDSVLEQRHGGQPAAEGE